MPSGPAQLGEAPDSPLPAEVVECLGVISATLLHHDRVVSVVLMGSAARDELSFARVADRLEVFGDLEVMAVTSGRLPAAARTALAAAVRDAGAGLGCRNALFHADVLFRERHRLRTMPPIVFTHELRECGRVLGGAQLLHEVRPVRSDELDRRNTREILVKRLWALAEAIPAGLARGRPLDELEERTLAVAIARNALDVPTVLLPEAGLLVAGYRSRVREWRARPGLPFRPSIDRAVGGDSGEWLHDMLATRAAARPLVDRVASLGATFGALEAGLAWLAHLPDGGDLATMLLRRGGAMFNERPIAPGEAVRLARQAWEVTRARSLVAGARWARARRKSRLAAALVHLERSLLLHLRGEAGARAELGGVWRALGPLAAERMPAGQFPDTWLSARATIGRTWWRAVRLGDPEFAARLAGLARH